MPEGLPERDALAQGQMFKVPRACDAVSGFVFAAHSRLSEDATPIAGEEVPPLWPTHDAAYRDYPRPRL
jgi:hypothetical protein